ncbi:uncharacterized protein [Watersipora subatra]|uniref:uncharacterized protein n=1 Tax=Watersipora subatra TaxID=2589382 RepID=UPI00355C780F
MQPLHVHVSPHKCAERPPHLSPMCGWEKEEAVSPQKPVVTPTKRKVAPETNTRNVQNHLLPLSFCMDESRFKDSAQESSVSNDKLLYLKVPDLKLEDLYDWSSRQSECRVTTVNPTRGLVTQKSSAGSTVEVNEELIALFRFEESVFAVMEKCPHAGGPLHLGDIEALPTTGSVCVTCPWHGWKMDLSSGKVLFPLNRSEMARVYKTMLDADDCIWIGFNKFSAQYFNLSSDHDF